MFQSTTALRTRPRAASWPSWPSRSAVSAAEAVPPPPAPRPAAPAQRPVRKHQEECDKELYEGGTCTCDLIEQYRPNTERDDY
ncbi:hypothetical protein [Streptomyces flaveolus]|uniref:hypothetical protein n=1 Tax=Streptomyces flaveolus TaxID=67297 RepID=UPI0037FB4DDF